LSHPHLRSLRPFQPHRDPVAAGELLRLALFQATLGEQRPDLGEIDRLLELEVPPEKSIPRLAAPRPICMIDTIPKRQKNAEMPKEIRRQAMKSILVLPRISITEGS